MIFFKEIENINNTKTKIKNNKSQTKTKFENLSDKDEEEIYSKVSKEFLENRKEGAWTKALIECEGDENKAKFSYMKSRAETLKRELLNLK